MKTKAKRVEFRVYADSELDSVCQNARQARLTAGLIRNSGRTATVERHTTIDGILVIDRVQFDQVQS